MPNTNDRDISSITNFVAIFLYIDVEYALSECLSTRVEYRFTDLGAAKNYNHGWDEVDTQDMTSHAVRLGLSYRF